MKEYKYETKEEKIGESVEEQGKGRIELNGVYIGKNIMVGEKREFMKIGVEIYIRKREEVSL